MPTSSSSPPSPPPTSASAVLAALLSSVAAYILGAIVLPYLSAFFKRDRALKKLDLPTPKARNFAERVFGTMARFDPTSPANYCRTVMQAWARECGEPPLMVSRGMQRHLVIVLDPAAANAVRERGFLFSSFSCFKFSSGCSLFSFLCFFLSFSLSLSSWQLFLLTRPFSSPFFKKIDPNQTTNPKQNKTKNKNKRCSPAPAARRNQPRPTLVSTSSPTLEAETRFCPTPPPRASGSGCARRSRRRSRRRR